MRLVVVSSHSQPVQFLTSLGYAPQTLKPQSVTDVSAFDPHTYGPEVLSRYLKEALIHHKKSTLLCLHTFLTYRQRRLNSPKFKMDALEILTMLSGHTFSLITYWCLKQPQFKDSESGFAETRITLKSLKNRFLTSYVNDHEVTKSPLILDFTNPQTYTLITHLDGSINNFLHLIPIENISLPI